MLTYTCVEGCFSVLLVPELDAAGARVGCRQEKRALEAIRRSFLQKRSPLASLRPSGCWSGPGDDPQRHRFEQRVQPSPTSRASRVPPPPSAKRSHHREQFWWSPPFLNPSPEFGNGGQVKQSTGAAEVVWCTLTSCGFSTLRGAERIGRETSRRGEGSSPGAK